MSNRKCVALSEDDESRIHRLTEEVAVRMLELKLIVARATKTELRNVRIAYDGARGSDRSARSNGRADPRERRAVHEIVAATEKAATAALRRMALRYNSMPPTFQTASGGDPGAELIEHATDVHSGLDAAGGAKPTGSGATGPEAAGKPEGDGLDFTGSTPDTPMTFWFYDDGSWGVSTDWNDQAYYHQAGDDGSDDAPPPQ